MMRGMAYRHRVTKPGPNTGTQVHGLGRMGTKVMARLRAAREGGGGGRRRAAPQHLHRRRAHCMPT